jgi:hypothetical protein
MVGEFLADQRYEIQAFDILVRGDRMAAETDAIHFSAGASRILNAVANLVIRGPHHGTFQVGNVQVKTQP